MLDQCRMFQALTNVKSLKKTTINTPLCLVCFVFPIQTTSCFPGNLPFVFSLIMHTYARGCTCIKRHLKKKNSSLGFRHVVCNEKTKLQVKNVYNSGALSRPYYFN